MRRKILFGIIFFILILVIVLLTPYFKDNTLVPTKVRDYKISSLIDYDNDLCTNTGYSNKPNGFNSGIKLILKDKETGKLIEGYGTTFSKEGGGDIGSENYSCEQGIDSENVLISAYSHGYATYSFIMNYPKDQLGTFEVLMTRSCSGGQSSFDNAKVYAKMIDNQTMANDYIVESQNSIYDKIKKNFGLEKSDYTLQCIESDMGRGGFIKAKGTYKDGSPLKLYYRWGWCSSGGSDCGWSACFSSASSNLFSSVKNNYCNKLSSRQLHDDYICLSQAYDNSTLVKNSCYSGDFEKVIGNEKSLSIIQGSSRCTDFVRVGDFNCLAN